MTPTLSIAKAGLPITRCKAVPPLILSGQSVKTPASSQAAGQPGPVRPRFQTASFRGEVPEWSNGAVSKTVERASVPRVRIPLSPPAGARSLRARGLMSMLGLFFRFRLGPKINRTRPGAALVTPTERPAFLIQLLTGQTAWPGETLKGIAGD